MITTSHLKQYTLQNERGMVVKLINYGGAITDILVPDRTGKVENVVLAFMENESYLKEDNPYLGSFIGRYANRIANASFVLDGITYTLRQNNNNNSLHGGPTGFHRKWWQVDEINRQSLRLTYTSPDGEEGYPGNLTIKILVAVGNDNSLTFNYSGTTDKATPVNLTNHSYFNLTGGRQPTILDHELVIRADRVAIARSDLTPTGELAAVANTPLDFNKPKRIGDDLHRVAGGYDHSFALAKERGSLEQVATVYDPLSGRQLELLTTEPTLQFYSGNFLNDLSGRGGLRLGKYAGLCLEPQHFPDSPNQPDFPNTILRPGETYSQTSVFRFSIR